MVITDVNQVIYNGDGTTTAFPFTFKIIDSSNIKLILIAENGLHTEITSDYYVDVENQTVYYPGYAPGSEPPEADQPPKVQAGEKLEIYRWIPINQLADLGEKWPFAVIEAGLDKLTMLLQDIYGWVGRNLINKVTGGTAWDAVNLPISNVGGPASVNDAATKDYVDRILSGIIESGDGRVIPYDTVAQMRAGSLEAGQIAFTLGYSDVNDGGAGVYTIRTATLSDTDDGGSIIILENGNVAELISDGMVNAKQFGAYGDGTHDDTIALGSLYNYASITGCMVNFVEGVYIIKNTVNVTSNYVMSGNATFKVDSPSTLERGVVFSPTTEVTRVTSTGECFINIDCNRKCNYGISSGIVARKFLYLKIRNALVCGFDDDYVGNSNAENTICCFVTNDNQADITTYGVIGTADNYYDVITTVNCKYAVQVRAIGTYINYLHPWSWPDAHTALGDCACIYIYAGSVSVASLYQDTIKYAIYAPGRYFDCRINELLQNSTAGYDVYLWKVDGDSGAAEISIGGIKSFLGKVLNYTMQNNVLFRLDRYHINNNSAFPVTDLNNLPDNGTFYVYADENTLNAPTTGGLNVLCFSESFIGTQIAIQNGIMYMRDFRVDNRSYGTWKVVNPPKLKRLSSWVTVPAGSYVDVTFTVDREYDTYQATVYGSSAANIAIISADDTSVVVRLSTTSENDQSCRCYLFAE